MAVKGRALLAGLRLRPGSVRLMALRFGLLALCFAPAYVAALLGLADRYGRQPELVGHPGPLPLSVVGDLLDNLPTAFSVLAGLGMAALLLFDQLLSAGALALLEPRRHTPSPPGVWRTVWREGVAHFWRFVRVKVLAVILFLIGVSLIGKLFDALGEHGDRAGYNGVALVVILPGLHVLTATAWLAVVGAFAFWCRLLSVADDRRRVRRTALLVLRVFRRRPVRALGFFVGVTVSLQLLGGALLVLLAPPHRGIAALARLVLWLTFLVVHSYLWHWLVHAGRLLYDWADMDELREAPDEPWGLWRRVRRWPQRWRGARRATAPSR